MNGCGVECTTDLNLGEEEVTTEPEEEKETQKGFLLTHLIGIVMITSWLHLLRQTLEILILLRLSFQVPRGVNRREK